MDANSIVMLLQDKLPRNDTSALSELTKNVQALSEKQRETFQQKIMSLNLKSPALVFWVGSFLFGYLGVGRFMIGDKGLGYARLILYLVHIVLYGTSISLALGDSYMLGSILGVVAVILVLAVFIWWVADLFLVGKKLRQKNYEKVLQVLKEVKSE